jgi:hypothetical protein
MKKLYSFLILLMLACSTSYKASAQADLVLLHAVSDTIECGNLTPSYIFPFGFVNLGPNALTSTDTLYLKTYYSGTGFYKLLLPGTGFPVGDTLYFSDTLYFENTFHATAIVQWCDSLWARNSSNAIIMDPVVANNKTCATVQIINDPASVKNVEARANSLKLDVYPNPASKTISFDFYANSLLEPTVSITDLTGRKVISQNLGKVNGAHKANIDVTGLNSGIYVIELTLGYKKQVGKFVIQN